MRSFTQITIIDRIFTQIEDRRGVDVAGNTRLHVLLGLMHKHLDAAATAMAVAAAAALMKAAKAGWLPKRWVDHVVVPQPVPVTCSSYRPSVPSCQPRYQQLNQMFSGSECCGISQRS
ncbi:MAG: hypothetical protein KDA92_15820 [Planctomycetales bacterium]|nr:hypothetical protein [Planctomycetales bacterium]